LILNKGIGGIADETLGMSILKFTCPRTGAVID
jgi:hypothetical protein